MPAVKKELPGREDLALALATFHPTLAALPLPPLPGYLAPLPAASALPPAASLPAATAGYEALLAPPLRPPRAYLSLHEAAPHLHLPRDPLALERFSATAAAAPDFQPLLDNGEPCIEVECGANRALLYVRKLCQGSKGPSIRHRGEWLTPNEFQFVSGRETAKDWKRSIRHKGAAAVGALAATVPPLRSPRTRGSGPPSLCHLGDSISAQRGRCDSGAAAGTPPHPHPKHGRLGGPGQSALGLRRPLRACRGALGSRLRTSRKLLTPGISLRDSWDLRLSRSLRELGRAGRRPTGRDTPLPGAGATGSGGSRGAHVRPGADARWWSEQQGKSLKTLMSKGILQVHPPICDCPGCRISSPVNRGRLADKRTVALPPTRGLKKELTPSFSARDGDSSRSGLACGQRLGLKQEDDPHVRIMKRRVHTHWDVNISFRETSCRSLRGGPPCSSPARKLLRYSQDSDLPTLISSVHRSRHLVMPEHQSRCEFQRGSVEIGLGSAGDLLGKRLGHSPHVSSDCPLEKKARSKSPQAETLLLPELGPSMAPEDHYRRLVSALSEASTFEDPQRLYHLGLPGHDLLRVRQEVAAAAVRSPSGLEVHLPSTTAGQRRKQGLTQHREGTAPAGTPSFSERELSQPPPLLSPQNAPHIALGPHLRPPFLGVSSALCQTPGYGFLPPAQAEMLARQQELLRKQNLARLEMSAELLRQKELESTHRPQLLAPEAALRQPDGAEELQRRGAMLVLRHSSAPLLALPPQGPPGPGPPTPPREPTRRAPRKGGPSPASARPSESKETTGSGVWAQDGSEDEPPKDSDGEDPEMAAAGGQGPTPGQAPAGGASSEGKGLLSGSMLPPPLPLGLPYAVSPCFHTGAMGGLFMDGEEATAPEDVSKWTVDDVCSFVGGLSGCGEYAPVFREQGIDGETLPLLTEEHLLTTMGLKLGPALKIRAQVAKRLGRVFYMASFPVALPLQPPTLRASERELTSGEQPLSPTMAPSPFGGPHPSAGRASPKQENGTMALLPGPADPSQPLC
ncbi:sterile alpha motif domain-containing protein 11 isoform X3 [Camelus ferus]|uniref:Sterile alpha motif domain-containing protein 11 isoform X3 n=1 Tax=Camelus ferus TaxID=419612 RepID=A0A8B8U803_CAMFR|nr:sterile alpha motif domain-containing protein 11 isoform X3 [Camelus ferus]